ncbi:hypothetical protein VN97_g4624 [Penicillium thymicola]|uniref:Uncharacterized protein n=1 Tax=Penicillium thymicola TaxID=293382 RepID=A0AAI9TK63_PENTH|nr:hypothetical protein VN97_g4624 [Penicillium thymicola]
MPSDNHVKAGLALIEDKSKVLGLTIGSHENVQPGTWLPRKATQEPPKLSFAGANPTSTYLVSDIKVTSEGVLVSDAPFIANYIGPAPPPMSAPHRYMFFLYEQPAGFDLTAHAPAGGKKFGNSNRMRYDLDAWAENIKLGPLVAFNYLTCN